MIILLRFQQVYLLLLSQPQGREKLTIVSLFFEKFPITLVKEKEADCQVIASKNVLQLGSIR